MEGKPAVGNAKPAVTKFQKAAKDVSTARRHSQQFALLASKYTELLEIISTYCHSCMHKGLRTHIENTVNQNH